jgi:hypothetical protein
VRRYEKPRPVPTGTWCEGAVTSCGDRSDVVGCSFFRNRTRVSPDRLSVAISGRDFTTELRTLAGALLNIFVEHTNNVLDFAFSPDGAVGQQL